MTSVSAWTFRLATGAANRLLERPQRPRAVGEGSYLDVLLNTS